MKKFFCSLLIIMLAVNLLTSCVPNNISQENSSNSIDPNTNISFLYSSNRLITENQAIFTDLIKDNPIDKAYYSAKYDETTHNMIKIEIDFAEIWNDELEYSLKEFASLLNENDKETFYSIQENWESYIENNYAILDDIFNKEEYQSYMGELFLVECASEYRNAIRQRTLYIKYLQFCLSSNGIDSEKANVKFNTGKTGNQ